MLDWLDRIPDLGVPGVPGVQPQKSATFGRTPVNRAGVPGVPEYRHGTPGTPAGTPAFSAKPLNYKDEHREHPEHRQNAHQRYTDVAALREGLQRLDSRVPLHGVGFGRWGVLVDDADWLFEHFAKRAATDGWSAADLFGVLPGHDAWGGVADRLQGSRSLVMTADLACWRRMLTGTPDGFARGASVMPKLTLLWEHASVTTGGAPHD
jgi:hypothetical protein